MLEVLKESFSFYNIVPSVFVLLSITYWFTVMLGALDMGFLDFDLDPDFESDVEIEIDTNVDSGEASTSLKILSFFNLGKVPFMVFFTCLSIPMWFIAVVSNHYLGTTNWIAYVLLIPNFFLSLFIAKIITTPLVSFFNKMEKEGMKNSDLVGKVCVPKFDTDSTSKSQGEVNFEGSAYIVNIKTHGDNIIKKGQSGLLISYQRENNLYIIESYTSI